MAGASELAQWYYLMYLLPGGIALALLLLSTLGGGLHRGHHSGGGMRHGGGRHSGVKHNGAKHRTGAAAARPNGMAAFFGLGRVPGPLVWGSALLGWGVFGFWGTQFWQGLLHVPSAFVLPALATALLGAFGIEKATVEAVSRLLPGDESFAVSTVELCGLMGTAAFPVDAARGRVHIYDAHGSLHDVSARTGPSAAAIARGRKVLVTDYDAVGDLVIVEETV